jgi:hypothetical protein
VPVEDGSTTELAAYSHPLERHLSGFPATVLALVYQLLIAAPDASRGTLDEPQILAATFGVGALV